MKLNHKQIGIRSYRFNQGVYDYFQAFGNYPSFDEMRIIFKNSTRLASTWKINCNEHVLSINIRKRDSDPKGFVRVEYCPNCEYEIEL